ncbi:GlcG/HbpS family heme-binding protein [Deinococcus hohokamensis]|uniref:Heme-binding protein n=1 Tax=Deinococcus hohokamensis TaxID=309883 RepID=A0ABV9ICW8_9DEIO
MKKSFLTAGLLVSVATAQTAPSPTPAPVQLATTATVQHPTLSLAAANRLAMQAVSLCAAQGYNVTATVVDRMGVTLSVARAENAGPHTVDASLRKAYTSASARNLTSAMASGLAANPTLADIPGFLVLAGGVPVRVNNVVVGAVGVGGAPSGLVDEKCAADAIRTVLGN